MLSVDIDPVIVLQVVLATPDQSIHFFNFALNLTVATAFTNKTFSKNCLNLSKLRRLSLEQHNTVLSIAAIHYLLVTLSLHECCCELDREFIYTFRKHNAVRL